MLVLTSHTITSQLLVATHDQLMRAGRQLQLLSLRQDHHQPNLYMTVPLARLKRQLCPPTPSRLAAPYLRGSFCDATPWC